MAEKYKDERRNHAQKHAAKFFEKLASGVFDSINLGIEQKVFIKI